MRILYTTFVFVLVSLSTSAQKATNILFSKRIKATPENTEIPTSKASYFELDTELLDKKMNTVGGRQVMGIRLPLPDGTFEEFKVKESIVMSKNLAAKFPNIKTYVGTSAKDGYSSVRLDMSPNGFHAMMFTPKGTVYIDPINRKNKKEYQSYYKKDFLLDNKETVRESKPIDYNPELTRQINELVERGIQRPSGTELRTYRLAIAATGEYTAFHGGTVEGALSAIVTTMNRVNAIYEKEVSIRMVLVDNTDQLIFTNATTDGFTNNNSQRFIDEVQERIDEIIGDSNYDIGHGVSTGGGGLASTGPCISGRKASGITGSPQPVGDPYDIDFVAHEIGHQFSASHTFNGTSGACSERHRSIGSAYEPGSGTTIMGYAGICDGQNIQSNSDTYFHTQSFDQIIAYTTLNQGNTCAVVTFTGNNAPIVDAGEGGFTIPISTPFKLNGSAMDPDGDKLTYSWEQFDLGPAGAPESPTENAPLFRSFAPTDESYRVFPRINNIINDFNIKGELLPDYARSLKFRLTARDNKEGGGGVNYDEVSFDVTDQAGPFILTQPNTNMSLIGLTTDTIKWDVANTNVAPVNCQKVNVLLSTNGGLDFSTTLISNTDNDGEVVVLIPNIVTSKARVKVEAVDNIFFDVSNTDFSIEASSEADFSVFASDENLIICATDDGLISIQVSELGEFATPVILSVTGLPIGYTAVFDTNPVVPGNDVMLTISSTGSEVGVFDLEIKGEAGGKIHTQTLALTVLDGSPETVTLQTPVDQSIDVSLVPTLIWNQVTGAETYQLQLSLDAGFINIVSNVKTINEISYPIEDKIGGNTKYFWRVRANNSCGEGTYSTINSFSTIESNCFGATYSGDPIVISSIGSPTISSTIEVSEAGIINDVNVKNIMGKHSWISDLTVVLKSPMGTSVTLFNEICGDNDDFDLGFDDQSIVSAITCPPTDKGSYIPLEALSNFEGESSDGIWTLEISDGANSDGGQLNEWSLEICVNGTIPSIAQAPTDLSTVAISSNQIDLMWSDSALDETSYVVERSLSSGLSFLEVVTLPANATSYSDISSEGGLTYFYRVKTLKNGAGNSFSNESAVTTPSSIPNAPSNLELVSKSSEHIKINWLDNSDSETSYVVERSVNNTSAYVVVATYQPNTTSYIDTKVFPEITYYYRVSALNSHGDSEYSNELEETTPVVIPAKPTNFSATVNSTKEISLSWQDMATNEISYNIERSVTNVNSYELLVDLIAGVENYVDTELIPGTKYSYRIVAVNAGGNSLAAVAEATTPLIAPSELVVENTIDNISLQWKDNSVNEDNFVIERSTNDNVNFVEIGTLPSNTLSYIDLEAESKTSYAYRVFARNDVGSSDYSNEVVSNLTTGLIGDVIESSIRIYPNPNKGYFTMKIDQAALGGYTILLTNVVGKVIHEVSIENQGEALEQSFDLSNQPKGIYLIEVINSGRIFTHRVIKY